MTSYQACSIVEGFSGEDHTESEVLEAWQYIASTGLWRSLQGWYGREVHRLAEAGVITLPTV